MALEMVLMSLSVCHEVMDKLLLACTLLFISGTRWCDPDVSHLRLPKSHVTLHSFKKENLIENKQKNSPPFFCLFGNMLFS